MMHVLGKFGDMLRLGAFWCDLVCCAKYGCAIEDGFLCMKSIRLSSQLAGPHVNLE